MKLFNYLLSALTALTFSVNVSYAAPPTHNFPVPSISRQHNFPGHPVTPPTHNWPPGGGGSSGGGGGGDGGGDGGGGDGGGDGGGGGGGGGDTPYVLANYDNAVCEQPPTEWTGGVTYYLDPSAAGNDSNSGLVGHPVKSWAKGYSLLNPAGGDTLIINSGTFNEDFDIRNDIRASWSRIIANNGQVPVFPSLDMSGSQRWLIQGIKIQHAPGAPNFDTLGNITHGSSTAKNIVLDSMNFSTADNGSSWTQTQWKNANFYGLQLYGSTETSYDVKCIALSRSLFGYVRTNLTINGQYILIADNEFSNPGWDVIDPIGDHINIVRNYVHDTHDVDWIGAALDPDGNTADHVDFVQAQVGECLSSYCVRTNYLIDGNVVIERTSPSITTSTEDTPATMDGIAIWDEAIDGFTITNNTIITSSTNPITVGNAYNGIIANNVVLATDNGGTDSAHNAINVDLHGNGNSSGAPASHDVRVFNNAASNIFFDGVGTNLTADNNDILTGGWYADGSGAFYKVAGIYGTNTIRSQSLTSYFVTYNYSTRTFDVHLKAGSLGLGAGTATGAPDKVDGTARTAPVDVGAY